MAQFYTEFLWLACADPQAVKKWWIATFDCKETTVPVDWDDSLPSDVVLKFPGSDPPTIQLRDKAEIGQTEFDQQSPGHPLIFCSNLKKAHEYVCARSGAAGPVQDGGGTQFFEVRDPEGNVIEICKEP